MNNMLNMIFNCLDRHEYGLRKLNKRIGKLNLNMTLSVLLLSAGMCYVTWDTQKQICELQNQMEQIKKNETAG